MSLATLSVARSTPSFDFEAAFPSLDHGFTSWTRSVSRCRSALSCQALYRALLCTVSSGGLGRELFLPAQGMALHGGDRPQFGDRWSTWSSPCSPAWPGPPPTTLVPPCLRERPSSR